MAARCGELEKALKNYGKSIELQAHYSDGWVKRGYANILAELGKHPDALEFIMQKYVIVNAGDRKGLKRS